MPGVISAEQPLGRFPICADRRFPICVDIRCPDCESRKIDEHMKRGWLRGPEGFRMVMWCSNPSCPLFEVVWDFPTIEVKSATVGFLASFNGDTATVVLRGSVGA